MTLLTTTPTVSGILPADYGTLIVQPVMQLSVAMQTSTIVTTAASSFHVPVLVQDVAAAWVAEGAEISPSDATFGEIVVSPSKVAALEIISTELANDSNPDAQTIVGQSMARSIAKRVDQAWLTAMAAPAPAGLASLTGATAPTTVAAGTSWTGTDPFATAISGVEVAGGTITAWIANPADVLALAKLKQGSALNAPLFGAGATSAVDRMILGVPLISNNQCPAGTIWGISRDRTIVVMRTDVTLSVSTDAFFTSDRVAVRATMRVGFAFPAPTSLAKITLG